MTATDNLAQQTREGAFSELDEIFIDEFPVSSRRVTDKMDKFSTSVRRSASRPRNVSSYGSKADRESSSPQKPKHSRSSGISLISLNDLGEPSIAPSSQLPVSQTSQKEDFIALDSPTSGRRRKTRTNRRHSMHDNAAPSLRSPSRSSNRRRRRRSIMDTGYHTTTTTHTGTSSRREGIEKEFDYDYPETVPFAPKLELTLQQEHDDIFDESFSQLITDDEDESNRTPNKMNKIPGPRRDSPAVRKRSVKAAATKDRSQKKIFESAVKFKMHCGLSDPSHTKHSSLCPKPEERLTSRPRSTKPRLSSWRSAQSVTMKSSANTKAVADLQLVVSSFSESVVLSRETMLKHRRWSDSTTRRNTNRWGQKHRRQSSTASGGVTTSLSPSGRHRRSSKNQGRNQLGSDCSLGTASVHSAKLLELFQQDH